MLALQHEVCIIFKTITYCSVQGVSKTSEDRAMLDFCETINGAVVAFTAALVLRYRVILKIYVNATRSFLKATQKSYKLLFIENLT